MQSYPPILLALALNLVLRIYNTRYYMYRDSCVVRDTVLLSGDAFSILKTPNHKPSGTTLPIIPSYSAFYVCQKH